jgi:hypothetical protein
MRSSCSWSFTSRTILLSIFLSIAAPHTRGDALDTLQLRNPLPTPDRVQSVGFGAGHFIAADDRGDVFRSPDGLTWSATGNVGTNLLLRFAYGGGRFVAYSSSGNVLSSEDGSVWTVRGSAPQHNLREITYGNGTFVAVGNDRVMTSPDGISWTTTFDVSGPGAGFLSISYGNGFFAAVMNVGFIYTSSDGITWMPHQPDAGYSLSSFIAYGNGFFIAPGVTRLGGSSFIPGIWASTNGNNWTRLSTNASYVAQQLIFGGGTFLGIGNSGVVSTSTDGTNWVQTSLPAGQTIQRAAYGNGVFVGVWPGYTVGSILRSSNGTEWTQVPVVAADRSFTTSAGAYSAGRYVLVGPSLATSTDGIHFTKSASAPNGINAITYSAGQFIVVSADGSISRSTDGLAWNPARSGTVKSLNSITYGAGRYVTVGEDGTIRVSQDGVLWAGAWSGTDYGLYGVAFGNGQFVAVGYQGIILTSPDGSGWTVQYNSDLSTLSKVLFDGARFVAVGSGGAVVTSANGIAWARQSTGITDSLQNITYGDGLYVAVGVSGKVFSSTDAVSWQQRSELGVQDVLGSAFLNNVWLLGGSGGTIYGTVPPGALILSAASNSANGNFEVSVSGGQIGATYQLLSCTNLSTDIWSGVTTFVQTQPVTVVPVPGGVGAPQCYYRAVSTP